MSGDKPEEGDKVSWKWGPSGTQPSGVVSEKKTEGEVSVTSHRGNEITKEAKPGDPAVALERSGNPVVKNQSEVQVEEKNAKPELKDGAKSPSNGTKRKHEESNGDAKDDDDKEEDEEEEEKEEKKEEKKEDTKKPAAEKKKPGRPAKAKADKPKPAAKEEKPKANGEKKRPGRPPKDPNAPPAAKKQKKEPREGTRKSSRLRN